MEALSDIQAVKNMLFRAKIPYLEEPTTDCDELAGAAAISLLAPVEHGKHGAIDPTGQPYSGGYGGFFSELVFNSQGELIALWAWE